MKSASKGSERGARRADAAELVKYARKYIKRGCRVFLTPAGSKKPFKGSHGALDATDDMKEIRKLARKYPDANLAMAMGRASGMFGLDIDRYKAGASEIFAELEHKYGALPETLTALTPRGGEHRIFKCDEKSPNWEGKLGPGFDVRGDGGYVMVAPSMFEGKKYQWKTPMTKTTRIPPNWLNAMRDASAYLSAKKMHSVVTIPVGARNGTLVAWAFDLKRRGKNHDQILEQLRDWNGHRCERPLTDKDVAGIAERVSSFIGKATTVAQRSGAPRPVRKTKTLADIDKMKLKPLVWALRGILPAGVGLMAGAPKIGKSLLVLQMALAITSAEPLWKGRKREMRGSVLYISYEDNHRRIRKRARQIMHGRPLPKRLHVDYDWPRMDQGGIEDLDNWLAAHPDTRLVIIDTLARFRSEVTTKRTAYDYDYATGGLLAPIAERHKVAIMLVHHTAKGKRADVLESINSTNGLPAGVDTVMVLGRERGTCDGSLFITGKDIMIERTWAMKKDMKLGWSRDGNLEDALRSPERKAIIEVLRVHGPMRPAQIAELVGKLDANIRHLLGKMFDDGEVTCVDGVYSAA